MASMADTQRKGGYHSRKIKSFAGEVPIHEEDEEVQKESLR